MLNDVEAGAAPALDSQWLSRLPAAHHAALALALRCRLLHVKQCKCTKDVGVCVAGPVYQGASPSLGPFGPLAQHGFVRNSEFTLADGGSTSVNLSLQSLRRSPVFCSELDWSDNTSVAESFILGP